jgi:hypothetical protein
MLSKINTKACMLLLYELLEFFFVAETDELSNLKLLDDIFKILEFIESKVSGK